MNSPNERLRILEDRLKLFVQGTGDLIYDVDCVTLEVDWGTSLLSFGYPENLTRTSLKWWEDRIHPEDAPAALREMYAILRQGQNRFDGEYRFQLANGSYRYVRDRGCVLRDPSGKTLRMVGHMEDLHLHHQMFLHNAQPMWVFHLESLQFLEVNDSAVRVYGYSREEFSQMFLTDIRPPEDRESLIATVRSPARGHEGQRTWRHITKDGRLLLVEVRTQDLLWRGQPARMAVLTDVTNRVALEEKLRTHEKIEAAGLIASGLAHDFNNLLTVINTQAERLSRQSASLSEAERQAAIEMIREAGERSAQWTRRLMDFARGRQREAETIDTANLIEGLAPFLRRLLPQTMRLELDLEPNTPWLHADPAQLEQILLNLTWNAAAACESSPAVLRIRTQATDRDGAPRLRIVVEDTGPGMPEAVASRVFEPLFSGRRDSSGAGLGLANVERLVKSMEGAIQLHTAPGEGSRFEIDLPAVLPAHLPKPDQPSARILLVDDDALLRKTLRSTLESAGHRVEEAANGADGLRRLLIGSFEILVTDLVMPEREGLELIQEVRSLIPDLPVIAISGAFDGQFLQLAKTFGATAALQKPLPPDRLLQAVNTILQRRAQQLA